MSEEMIERTEATEERPKRAKRPAAEAKPAFVGELDGEKKVRIKIPADKMNPGDTSVAVGINGYIYQIKRGETVDAPETVANILEEAGYI